MGFFEFERIKTLIERHIFKPQITIIDVGGGTGKYSEWLAKKGHDVHLIEPVQKHITLAKSRANSLKNKFSVKQGQSCNLEIENECNIKIKNHYRDRNWFIENPNSYQEHYEEEGFIKILDGPPTKKDLLKIKKHDGIMMKYLGKNFPTHGAIYVGSGLILHHQINCYSRIEPYDGTLLERTVGTLRHESLL